MNLDELQSVRDRERQTDKLQQLRESFYADAGQFIQQLRAERERAAERAEDPFDAPEVNQLTDEIDTAEQTVEAIYEKRVGKIVKAASFAAADLPAQVDGMTAEEQALFDTLVEDIRGNRERVLDVLAGEDGQSGSGAGTSSPADGDASAADPDVPAADPDVPAADLMGGSSPGDEPSTATPATDEPPTADPGSRETAGEHQPPTAAGQPPSEVDRQPAPSESEQAGGAGTAPASGTERAADQPDESAGAETVEKSAPEPPVRKDGGTDAASAPAGGDGPSAGVERETVRITEDLDTFVGFDDRDYDLGRDDVVTLPATNARLLVEQDAAEQLE